MCTLVVCNTTEEYQLPELPHPGVTYRTDEPGDEHPPEELH